MNNEEAGIEKSYNADPIIWIYTLSSLLSLMVAFLDSLSPVKSANCFVLSWLFALGALGITVLCDTPEETADDHFLE
jgi:hypothetical protein